MPQSYVSNINFKEQRFIGPAITYDGSPFNISNPGPYILDISVSSQVPNPETSVCKIIVTGVPGQDADGTVYSGQFRLKRNVSTGNASITVSGQGLSNAQIATIKSSISLTETTDFVGLDDVANLTVNLTPIARSGIKKFTVNIPFEDSNINVPNNNLVIPFLDFDGSGASYSNFPNPITVSIDSGELSINAGSIRQTLPAMNISKAWSSSRDIVSANVYFNNVSPLDYKFHLDVVENFENQEGIRFIPSNVPSLPSTDNKGITTDLNYNVQISSLLWNLPAGGFGGGATAYRESGTLRRLSYSIIYGIGKPDGNGSIISGEMLKYFIHVTKNCNLNIRASGADWNGKLIWSYTCDDTGAPSRRPFSVTNRTGGVIQDLILNINRNDSSTNYYRIVGNINGPVDFTYQGFSNDMTVSEFIEEFRNRLSIQFPSWYNSLVFTISPAYAYTRMGDMRPEFNSGGLIYSYPNTPNTVVYRSIPENAGTVFTKEIVIHDMTINPPIRRSFYDLQNLLIQNFGSYGLTFNWFIPNVPEWRNLTVVPLAQYWVNDVVSITNNGNLVGHSLLSGTSSLVNISCQSTHYDQVSTNISRKISTVRIDTSSYPSLASFGQGIENQLNSIIVAGLVSGSFPSYPNLPPALKIKCVVASDFYSSLSSYTYLKSILSTQTATVATYPAAMPPNWISYWKVPNASSSVGNSLLNNFSKLSLFGSRNINLSIQGDPLATNLGDFINDINNPSNGFSNILSVSLIDANYGSTSLINTSPLDSWDIVSRGNVNINAQIETPYVRRYQLSRYQTLSSLANAIQSDWFPNIQVAVNSATNQHSDARPSKFLSPSYLGDIRNNPLPKTLSGTVVNISNITIPTENVTISYDISFASNQVPVGSVTSGVQVALGGYEKDGVFYPYKAPNAFFEPVYNTAFPINFTTIDADVVYLLVKSRQTENSNTVFTSNASCYTGLVKYSNGYNPYSLNAFIPTDAKFTNAWTESGLGVPSVISIPVYSTVMDVSIEDSCIIDSVSLKITNKTAQLDQFGFLAVNRTNNTKSQTKSKVARVFGLVLDNRASWDVLISPEATLSLDTSGTVFHLGSFYNRNIIDDDEGYDLKIVTDLPAEVSNAISILPVPGNPQVWVLRIEYGVKRYLANLISQTNDQESLNGCYINIDILAKGRTTGVEGTARVTIYYDYTCVYDIGLCDFFWNLIDPPKPTGPEIIQNRIELSYETLVDCSNLTTPINYNIAVNAPIIITANNIPTFRNGNALLLIKSSYTPEIQGFYFPIGNQLDALQFSSCSNLNSNLPLMQRLNKEFLLLPNASSPVTDIFEIRNLLESEDSYLYVKPQFGFPPDDNIKDCNSNEIVVVGIGYTFKNWINGVRTDDVVLGLNLLFPQGLFTSPEINICYRYYYNQKET